MLTFGGWNAILTKSVGDTDKKPTDKTLMWGLSSAGRASALQAEGHRFEPCRPHFLCLYYFLSQAIGLFFFVYLTKLKSSVRIFVIIVIFL